MKKIGILLLAGMLLLSDCALAAQSEDAPEPASGYRQMRAAIGRSTRRPQSR